MPNISLPDAMLDYAERQVEAGVYANLSEVVRAGLRKLMEEDGATAFYLLRRDLGAAITEPTEEADLRALLLDEPPQPWRSNRDAARTRRSARSAARSTMAPATWPAPSRRPRPVPSREGCGRQSKSCSPTSSASSA